LSDTSLSDSAESVEAPQIEQPLVSRRREQPRASLSVGRPSKASSLRVERPPRAPKRKDRDCDAELKQMIESLREQNEQSMIEERAADDRERYHHFRLHEPHPSGIPVENPRGRAVDFDFEIRANTDELPIRTLPPFVRMINYSSPKRHDSVSRQILKK